MSSVREALWFGVQEAPLLFACHSDTLVGVLAQPAGTPVPAPSDLGVVIVVGGPQMRAGSHRQFVDWARALANAGFPCLRFDVRGMGDSTGSARSFESLSDDLTAAIDALTQAAPQVRRVVLLGLCDGASAVLLHAYERTDARVAGHVLLNPWVRSAAGLARAHLRHYYVRRLLSGDFWRKLLQGQVGRTALRELSASVRTSVTSGESAVAAPTASRTAGSAEAALPAFPRRMAWGLAQAQVPTLVVLSGNDLTAQEFRDHLAHDADWRNAVRSLGDRWTVEPLPDADHTLSDPRDGERFEVQLVAWMRALARPTERVRSVATVDALSASARALLAQAEQNSLQYGADWLQLLQQQVLEVEGSEVQHWTLERDGSVQIVWSVARRRDGAVQSCSNYYCALTGPVMAAGATVADVAELATAVRRGIPGAHTLRLEPLDADHPHTERLTQGLKAAGFAVFPYFRFGNWFDPAPGGWTRYLEARSANLRSTVRRSIKRLEAAGGRIEIVRAPEGVDRAIRAFEQVYAASWKQAEPHPAFFRRLAERLARTDALRLGIAWLPQAGREIPIAAQFWTVVAGRVEIHKLAYDETYKALGAGTALTARLMEHCLDQDQARSVDYLIGDDSYKAAWMPQRRERIGLLAAHWRHPRGAATAVWESVKRWGKLRSLPLLIGLALMLPAAPGFAQPSGRGPAEARGADCAPVAIPYHYGPYDYLTEKAELRVVERHHFAPQVEQLVKGQSGTLGADLAYTLNAAPNHHKALASAMQLAQRLKTDQPPDMRYPVSCYLDRATRFRPRDTVVRSLYALHLGLFLGRIDDAVKQVAYAEQWVQDNPMALHNLGLVYLELKQADAAQRIAQQLRAQGLEQAALFDRLAVAR